MPQNLVLVTGAAGGDQGQTGRHVSQFLLAQGVPVRSFVHRIDERSERLRALGADVFEGDLLDIASVRTALRDVDHVYFAYPLQDGLLDATGIMAVNARDAGVSRLVNLVMLRSSLERRPRACSRTTYRNGFSIGQVWERCTFEQRCSLKISARSFA